MNIFATSPCPMLSARFLDDKRVRKMILESAQLASTAIVYYYSPRSKILFDKNNLPKIRKRLLRNAYAKKLRLYKPSHINHPCAIWCRKTRSNFEWLLEHMYWLHREYEQRFNKTHKSYIDIFDKLTEYKYLIPEGERTPFVNCAANDKLGISFKHIDNVHLAYRSYLYLRFRRDKIVAVTTLGDIKDVQIG